MLKSILLHVQQQPKSVRNQYATAVAAVFTGFVAVIWLVTQSSALSTEAVSTGSEAETAERTPFSTLVEQGKKQFAAARAALEQDTTTVAPDETEVAIDATTLILTEETITDVAAVVTEAPAEAVPAMIRIATSSEVSSPSAYREVQIVTTPTTPLPEITQ